MNELAVNGAELPANLSTADDSALALVAKSGSFLPRIQLIDPKSDLAMEGKAKGGDFCYVSQDEVISLGNEFNFLCIAWRPKAAFIDKPNNTVITEFDVTSEQFLKMKQAADIGGKANQGNIYGPEYLIWVASVDKFAAYHLNNKTARRAYKNIQVLLGKRGTVRSKLIETPDYKWFGPVFTGCSLPFDIPTMEVIAPYLEDFNNPPKSKVEVVSPVDQPAQRDR